MAVTTPGPAGDTAAAAAHRRQRYGLLLLALLAALLVQGMAPPGKVQQVLTSALLGATLLLALRVSHVRPALFRAAAVVTVALVCVTAVQAVAGEVNVLSTSLANALLVSFAPPAVAIGVVRTLRRSPRIPVEAVMGVLCLYL